MTPAEPLRWLLDTNVLAEPLRPVPVASVVQRLKAHAAEVAVPATVWQELNFGWLRMPDGRRRDRLGEFLTLTVAPLPVLSVDARVARIQADVRAGAERQGRPIDYPDSEIAAIAIAHGLTLVTRNTRDFQAVAGLRLIDWFQP